MVPPSVEPLARLSSRDGGWRLSGDMTFHSVSVLLSSATNLINFHQVVHIDLEEVARSDSAGLALMLEWLDQSRRQGGRLHFHHIPEELMAIAQVSNVSALLTE